MSIPVGLQLYSLREDAAENFVDVLKAVSEMGYDGVEFAGYWDLSAKELTTLLGDLNLKVAGSHVGFPMLDTKLNEVIEFNLELGNKYVVCPSPTRELYMGGTAEQWKAFGERLCSIGEELNKHGLRLAYHNHSREFDSVDGKYPLDILFDAAKPENLLAEIDLGWTFHAGVDPIAYFKKYKGRCPLVHIKDFHQGGDQTEVGTGDIDLKGITEAAPDVGVEWYIIETERYNMAPRDSVRVGLENLKAVLGR
ncbi:MAG: sugar phosphate isomerase/epimerase [Firmicutes bacterium]|nr:sugar phosphate isomerase/epimerase [Bacillota bacterium]